MNWTDSDLVLRGIHYKVSRRLTFSKPGGGGEIYAAAVNGEQVCLGLPSPSAEALTPAEAEHIQGLSLEGYLPVRALDWWQGQPVFSFGAVQLTPLDQTRREPDWSQQWVVEQVERLALAIDRCPARLDSAARVQLGRIVLVEPGRNLLLLPPLRLNRAAAAKAEDIRQLALVAAWLLTGAWLNGAPEDAHFINRAAAGQPFVFHAAWKPGLFTRELQIEVEINSARSDVFHRALTSLQAQRIEVSHTMVSLPFIVAAAFTRLSLAAALMLTLTRINRSTGRRRPVLTVRRRPGRGGEEPVVSSGSKVVLVLLGVLAAGLVLLSLTNGDWAPAAAAGPGIVAAIWSIAS